MSRLQQHQQPHKEGLALCHRVTLDTVAHRWVPARAVGGPQQGPQRQLPTSNNKTDKPWDTCAFSNRCNHTLGIIQTSRFFSTKVMYCLWITYFRNYSCSSRGPISENYSFLPQAHRHSVMVALCSNHPHVFVSWPSFFCYSSVVVGRLVVAVVVCVFRYCL